MTIYEIEDVDDFFHQLEAAGFGLEGDLIFDRRVEHGRIVSECIKRGWIRPGRRYVGAFGHDLLNIYEQVRGNRLIEFTQQYKPPSARGSSPTGTGWPSMR
jgi:hypothetical protein